MKVTLTVDEVAEPDVAAAAWDDYLHLFGAAAYVLARYNSARPDTSEGVPGIIAVPMTEHRL